MLHLAVHNEAGPVPLAEISVCQGISMSYVDQIFALLRKSDLVTGIPGPGGGYRLSRPADVISVGEVVRAIESDRRRAQRGADDLQRALEDAIWRDLGWRIDAFLDGITLANFAQRPAVREAVARQYRLDPWRCRVCGVLSYRGGARSAAAARDCSP